MRMQPEKNNTTVVRDKNAWYFLFHLLKKTTCWNATVYWSVLNQIFTYVLSRELWKEIATYIKLFWHVKYFPY